MRVSDLKEMCISWRYFGVNMCVCVCVTERQYFFLCVGAFVHMRIHVNNVHLFLGFVKIMRLMSALCKVST